MLHYGNSTCSGHYINMLRDDDNRWIEVDDSKIKKTFWPANAQNVYILFLEEQVTSNYDTRDRNTNEAYSTTNNCEIVIPSQSQLQMNNSIAIQDNNNIISRQKLSNKRKIEFNVSTDDHNKTLQDREFLTQEKNDMQNNFNISGTFTTSSNEAMLTDVKKEKINMSTKCYNSKENKSLKNKKHYNLHQERILKKHRDYYNENKKQILITKKVYYDLQKKYCFSNEQNNIIKIKDSLARKIKKKYINMNLKSTMKFFQSTEKYIRNVMKKLNTASLSDTRIEAETLVSTSICVRDNYISQLKRTLQICQDKIGASITRLGLNPIEENVPYAPAATSEAFFAETAYDFKNGLLIGDSMKETPIIINEEGQSINILPITEESNRNIKTWECNEYCITVDPDILKELKLLFDD